MNPAYVESMGATVDRLEAEKDDIKGVVITSAKKTFFAGGDLNDLKTVTREHAAEFAAGMREIKGQLRRLETLGKPVVAAINGAALGGGLEIALAAHHRIIVDDPKVKLGLPEVKLGLLPGGGGVVRTVRMLGIVDALMKLLLQGQETAPGQGQGDGPRRRGRRHARGPDAGRQGVDRGATPRRSQPWDVKGYKMPGGTPSNPKLAMNLPAFPANLRKQLKGANYPAPHHIMAAAVEGAQVDFDNAIEIEGRYFTDLVTGQVAKNMIQAFFFDLQQVNGDRGRPRGHRALHAEEGRRARRRHDGRRDRLRLREGRHRGRPQGRRPGGRRARQGLLARLVDKAVSRGRSTQEKGDALLAPDHADRRPGRRGRRRPRHRGGLRGPGRQGAGLRRDRAAPRRGRPAGLQHLDPADHRAWPRASRARPTSSGCTSSAPWTRCRCWRSSRASRPATRRSTARSTSPSRSGRRRSSSTTRAASSPRA